MVVTVIGKPAV